MARAADLLLSAADRRVLVGEDRLTEILATVLQHDRRLAAWFCEQAGVETPSDGSHEVSTQVWLDESSRPDMQIAVRHRDGTIRRVLSEHKTGTGFSVRQERSYTSMHERWIGLVRRSERVPEGYTKVSWSDVARQADRIASEELVDGKRAGARWRRRALKPEVPSRLRVLHELLSYIERSDVDVTAHSRIEHLDTLAYGGSRRARATVEALFHSVCAQLPGRLRGAHEPEHREGLGDSWVLRLDDNIDSWAENYGVTWWCDLLVAPVDDWREDGYGEPAFGAGLCFGREPRKPIQWPRVLDPESDWPRELRAKGISVGETDGGWVGRCFRTLYLSEVMSRGSDLDEQAKSVADWATEAVDEIRSLTPPATTESQDPPPP